MMKYRLLILTAVMLLMFPPESAMAQDWPDGLEVMKHIDRNMVSENQVIESTMIVHGRRSSRTITSRGYMISDEKSFSEYLSPPREKGTKMLKLEDKLWIYSPSTNRVIQIAGHMLRQSVMGSDLSYEDFTEADELEEAYDCTVIGEEQVRDRPAYVVELIGKKDDLAYAKRKVWVDSERWVALREERFARSGKLLKTTDITEVFKVQDRWYPKHMIFKDVLKKGKGTEFIIDSIKFDQDIPEHLFTKAALRK
jgi:outer membrane lipoprotein-sorting protein